METSLAEDVKKPTRTLSPDSFFFMSPYRSFTTSGCFRRFSQPAVGGDALNGEFQQQMAAAFAEARAAGIRKPVMVGAIPFDTCQPSELYIPERWEAFSRPEKQRSARYAAPLEAMEVVERREIPEQDAFLAMVERAAALTATPEVDKVVLSRLIDITTRDRVDSGALMERLIAQNPASFNFHVPLSDGGVLLGASRSCCCVKKDSTSALCRWPAPPVASRTMCWIGKQATGCWPPAKIATSTSW